MKYKRKPVILDAEQFVVYSQTEKPTSKQVNGVLWLVYKDEKGYFITIPSLEGNHRCDNLDWIVKGIQGEFWAVKPDIFEKTYEKA